MNPSSPQCYFPCPRPALKSTQRPRTLLPCTWSSSGASTPSSGGSSTSTVTLSSSASSPAPSPYYIPSPASPHVHFPPTSGLAKTYAAYSRTEYDRSPTIVTENHCAMPKRGCPGRTFYSGSGSSVERIRTGRSTQRCATPGPSRSGSRTRSESPDSQHYYVPQLYRDDYPFPAPGSTVPSLVTDNSSSSSLSGDERLDAYYEPTPATTTDPALVASQQLSGLGFLFPEFNSHSGSEPGIYAPGHPPISHPNSPDSVYQIAQELNGMGLSDSGSSTRYDISTLASAASKPKVMKKKKVVSKVMFKTQEDDGLLGGF